MLLPPPLPRQAVESFGLSLVAWGLVRPGALPRRVDVALFSLAAGFILHCYSDHYGQRRGVFRSSYLNVFDFILGAACAAGGQKKRGLLLLPLLPLLPLPPLLPPRFQGCSRVLTLAWGTQHLPPARPLARAGNTGFGEASISHHPSNADLLLRGVRSVR